MSASTRSARTTRRQAAKRTILGALDDNNSGNTNEPAVPAAKPPAAAAAAANSSAGTNGGTTFVPADLDGTSPDQIRLLVQDLEREVRSRTDALTLRADEAVAEQREVAFLGGIKLGRDVKKMTVREFDVRFGCDVLAEIRRAMAQSVAVAVAEEAGGNKKRVRPKDAAMALETPAVRRGGVAATPGTVLRTVKKGEAIFSVNGSPVDHAEEGDLVATVAKKRKGGNGGGGCGGATGNASAAFDINVGDGRYISLSDPTTVEHLDDDMKSTAMNQLKILQDQMASLMAQLGN